MLVLLMFILKEDNMKEYTVEQRRAYARNLDIKVLMSLVEQYKDPTPNTMESVIYDVLNAEVERRILNWEVACV
jgi:hypothetical protein